MATATKQRYRVREGIFYARNPDWSLDPDATNQHRHDSNQVILYKAGAIITSEENLMEKFVNKFEKVIEAGPVVVSEARKKAVDQLILAGVNQEDDRSFLESLTDDGFDRVQRMTAPKSPMESRKVVSPLGEDVTDLFGFAYDHGFKVFRNPAGKHQITKGAATKPINPKPLDAAAIDEFLATYLREVK